MEPVSSLPDLQPTQSESNNPSTVKLSKKEKKALKQQIRTQKLIGKRPLERKLKRERKKFRKAMQEQSGLIQNELSSKKRKRNWNNVEMSPYSLIVDLEFDDLMVHSDIVSLSTQLRQAYGVNKNLENPWSMYWCGYNGQLKTEIEKNEGWKHWKITIDEKPYIQSFAAQKLVYLTADSKNVLTSLDPNKIYIIGGIVDHNKLKNLTLNKAEREQIETAQLPISEYLQLNSRKVLTVNQIIEILLYYGLSGDWEEAFLKTIPQRKIQVLSNSMIPKLNEGEVHNETI
jgi:tRNA (guanine9-N1)-methyltransferase